jgi:cytochrome c oxidase subunit 3
MLALPPAAPPAPRRQLLVGTALACVAGTALLGGMLALWMQFRDEAIASADGRWLPKGIVIPEVATNVMLIAFLPICVFAQWAVYSAKRDDKPHTALALGLTGMLGLAVVNAQAFVYAQMELPASGGAYNSMFYALTGVFTLLVVLGIAFSAVTAFRYLGGRTTDREIVAAHAMYWYFLSVGYSALWLVVYVTK